MGYIVSVALYVLQAIGLYTIAKRRGIRHAWLAWVPVACLWILGGISDEFKTRITGRAHNKRKALTILSVVLVALYLAILITSLSAVLTVYSSDQLWEFARMSADVGEDMYQISEQEFLDHIVKVGEENVADQTLPDLLVQSLGVAALSFILLGVGIAALVIECICVCDLYDSCEPGKKTLYFLLGLFLGIQGVFIFLCRDKDVAVVTALPPKEPWET